LFDAGHPLAGFGMLGWHNVWMSRHGRELAGSALTAWQRRALRRRPLLGMAFPVALACCGKARDRLFLYASRSPARAGRCDGGWRIIGLAFGVAAGTTIYWGLVSIPMALLFRL